MWTEAFFQTSMFDVFFMCFFLSQFCLSLWMHRHLILLSQRPWCRTQVAFFSLLLSTTLMQMHGQPFSLFGLFLDPPGCRCTGGIFLFNFLNTLMQMHRHPVFFSQQPRCTCTGRQAPWNFLCFLLIDLDAHAQATLYFFTLLSQQPSCTS